MKLYTRTGDEGKTSLIGGRVEKDNLRVEAYGTIDELNSFVGYTMTLMKEMKYVDMYSELQKIQHELFDCGGDLAIVKEKIPYKVTAEMITFLEERIDDYIKQAPNLERFILPGGTQAAAAAHLARTITRRAERCIVSLKREEVINDNVLKYINRLSDYFFAISRVINARAGESDIEYERSAIVFRSKDDKKE